MSHPVLFCHKLADSRGWVAAKQRSVTCKTWQCNFVLCSSSSSHRSAAVVVCLYLAQLEIWEPHSVVEQIVPFSHSPRYSGALCRCLSWRSQKCSQSKYHLPNSIGIISYFCILNPKWIFYCQIAKLEPKGSSSLALDEWKHQRPGGVCLESRGRHISTPSLSVVLWREHEQRASPSVTLAIRPAVPVLSPSLPPSHVYWMCERRKKGNGIADMRVSWALLCCWVELTSAPKVLWGKYSSWNITKWASLVCSFKFRYLNCWF